MWINNFWKYQITQLFYQNCRNVVVVSAKVVIWKLAKKGPKVAYIPLLRDSRLPREKRVCLYGYKILLDLSTSMHKDRI